mmetsp:Transcript_70862/g.153900  ORF Transcript_70862/g.153900 Transcript_70862/m.153900 type:complete len:270 (-) Transcript_70862:118-927(-)|eukprot:CAMPEP_0170615030 /NCGR_PEP_ID=MMETSP0224-20130122/25117_1 /TAXON_ID=285029 /ORGANISM="Togula jolla, Strain CCCM 725" /LENGTH=269 /DNA_ID=CAMNT_0010940729 /DNA_START=60 /DNA_END=869 /DNA_ORIENTATION=+
MADGYDPENIFAKIIDGTMPSFKVFESRSTLAILDAFPMVEGHTLVLPKLKGYKTFLEMPSSKSFEFLRDVQRVAQAVQKATGATGINIWQNNGEDAGQVVHHPHFHVVPRFKDDGLHKYPASAKEMLSTEAATPVMKKISDVISPARPLKKPTFSKVSSLNPDSVGLNILVEVTDEPAAVDTKIGTFSEVVCGDETGTVIVSLRDTQKDLFSVGKSLVLRNCGVKMVKGHIRLVVDKWGKIEESSEAVKANKASGKDVSGTEYELVTR